MSERPDILLHIAWWCIAVLLEIALSQSIVFSLVYILFIMMVVFLKFLRENSNKNIKLNPLSLQVYAAHIL